MKPLRGGPTGLSWICGRMPIPTFPSTSKPNPSTPGWRRIEPHEPDGSTEGCGFSSPDNQDLKRFLLIFNDRIFDSSVDRGIPNLVAAPVGPKTRPALSFH